MKTTSLTLTQDTSIEDVVYFLNFQNSESRIRAKDLGDGNIKLYVRKDTFKQFFTDKLRSSDDVQHDYNKARGRILDIIKKTDPDGENSRTLLSIKASLKENKHDFILGAFNGGLKNALYSKGAINKLINTLILGQTQTNLAESIQNNRGIKSMTDMQKISAFINDEKVNGEIQKVFDSIENFDDKKLFLRNFRALERVTSRPSTSYGSLEPSIIDYKCAVDFFRVWLKETKNTNPDVENLEGSKLSNEINNKLKKFAETVVHGAHHTESVSTRGQ